MYAEMPVFNIYAHGLVIPCMDTKHDLDIAKRMNNDRY
jgi:hypothetical protein